MKNLILLGLLLVGPASATPLAPADPPPPPAPSAIAPWLLRDGWLRLDATLEIGMSADRETKPVAIAPDLWYGATSSLTLGIVHSRFATTGFRGAAGGSLCVTSASTGCAQLYNNVGIEAWAALVRGSFALVAGGGLEAVNIDRGSYDVKVGFKSRFSSGRVAFTLTPSVFLAATNRNDTPANPDVLYAPIGVGLKVTDGISIALGSGIKGPISGFSKGWQVPVGLNATYALGPVVVGVSWVFGALVSAANNPPAPAAAVEGPDVRVVQAWLSYSIGHSKPKPAHTFDSEPTPSWIETETNVPASPAVPPPAEVTPPATTTPK